MKLKLYSYVVDHDYGFAPNPSDGFCTLVHCMFNKNGILGRKNLVESVSEGDWILGTGGKNRESSGHGSIRYLMRVDEKQPFEEFLNDARFINRVDQCDRGEGNTLALISKHFYYFGRNALFIAKLPDSIKSLPLEKSGQRYRSDLPPDKVQLLISWFEQNYEMGIHGQSSTSPRNDESNCAGR